MSVRTVGTRDAVLVELQLGGSARHRAISIRAGQSLREELLLWRRFRRDRIPHHHYSVKD